jgi:hypothetical protein
MFSFYQLSSTAIFTGCLAFTINAAARIRPIVPLHVGGGVLLTLGSLYLVTDAYGAKRMKYTYMY